MSPFHSLTRKHARPPSSSAAELSFIDEPNNSQRREDARNLPYGSTEKPDFRNKIEQQMDRLFRTDSNSATHVRKAYQASKREDGEMARRMNFPDLVSSKDLGSEVLEKLSMMPVTPRSKRTVRSRPMVGRTVELDPAKGMDFGKGLRQLGMLCAQNNVRGDLMTQRFHERPGMKRKRLKQQRWRKLFKSGFSATVGRVKEMRRKGW